MLDWIPIISSSPPWSQVYFLYCLILGVVGAGISVLARRKAFKGRQSQHSQGGNENVGRSTIAAGPTGGAAEYDGVWRAPAKSTYEIHQRKMGLPIDPLMRQYGRGKPTPGYDPKLQFVEQLRAAYFREHRKMPQSILEKIDAVPLEYLNSILSEMGKPWRVRIVDDEYEFFIPGC